MPKKKRGRSSIDEVFHISFESDKQVRTQKPTNPNLIRVYDSLDENVFRNIVKNNELNKDKIEHNLELFWECCQIPDFEKKAYGQHLNIVKSVFQFLTEGKKYIPNTFLKKELDGLDKTHNNLDVISNRISKVRTWAYVSNKKNWVENSDYWIQVTKQIEDNLSDRLHKELTQSFINKKISVLSKGLKQDLVLETNISDSNEVLINNQRIGVLKGLKLDIDVSSNTLDTDIKSIKKAARKGIEKELIKRVENILSNTDLSINNENKIIWKNNPIARLKKGSNYLNPEFDIIADDSLDETSKLKLTNFLAKWLDNYVNDILGDLIKLTKHKINNQYLRGLVFQLYEKNGVVKRNEVDKIVKLIPAEERKKLWGMGIKIGRYHIYLPKMLKPKAVEFRISLWNLFHNVTGKNSIPKSGLNFLVDAKLERNFLLLCGFEKFKEFFVRIDILEKLFIKIIDSTKDRKFKINSSMMNLLGCSKENFFKLMNYMNYKKDKEEDTYIFKGEKKKKEKLFKFDNKENPFNKLRALNIK